MAKRRKKKQMYTCSHCGQEFDFDIRWCETGKHHNHYIFMHKIDGRTASDICIRCESGKNDEWLIKRGLKKGMIKSAPVAADSSPMMEEPCASMGSAIGAGVPASASVSISPTGKSASGNNAYNVYEDFDGADSFDVSDF